MSEQNGQMLNRLMARLGSTDLVSARWLQQEGYSRSLLARYVRSGWLVSPARGVYHRKGAVLKWSGVLHSLEQFAGLDLHAGGRFALAWHGHEHYLRIGHAATVTVYGSERLPNWVQHLDLPELFYYAGRGPFRRESRNSNKEVSVASLLERGLQRVTDPSCDVPLVFSCVERAILELCDESPGASLIIEIDALMQGLTQLRPDLMNQLLPRCNSIKAKRLFLALAERHNHAWFKRLQLDNVDLGSGKRVLVRGGRLNSKYQITLPADLDEQHG